VGFAMLGQIYSSQGDTEHAIKNLSKAVELKPYDHELNSLLGVELTQNGDVDAAVASFEQALKIKPDYAEAYNGIGTVLNKKGELDAAIDSYNQALKIKPDYADAYFGMGSALNEKGDLDAAIDSYKQALKIKPDFTGAFNNMGNVLRQKGDLEAAIESFKQVLKIKPDAADAYNNMGFALNEKGKPDAAIASYKQAIKIKPNYADAYNNMGNALKEKGELDAAIDSYKQALKINPDYANAHNNIGIALLDKDDFDGAIDSYKRALKINPDYVDTHNNIGVALLDKDDFDGAIDSFKRVLKINPDYVKAHSNMGVALQAKGEPYAAIDSFKRALKIKPDYAEVWDNVVYPLQSIKLQTSSVEDFLPLLDKQEICKYTQIAESILSYRLHLGRPSTDSYVDKVLSLLSSANNIFIKNPKVPSSELITGAAPPEKITALVHFGRSGTGLLHSLIDGHPEVSTIPSIYFNGFFYHSTWKKITAGGWDEMADRFIAAYAVLFDASSPNPIPSKSGRPIHSFGVNEGLVNVGKERDEVLRVDKKVFCEELKRLMGCYDQLDAFAFFKLAHSAYDVSLNDLNKKSLIFYHIHDPDTYSQLNFLRSAPNSNCIMMVREPVQSCEAWVWRSFRNNNYSKIANTISQMLFEVDKVISNTGTSIGVRLEDLKEYPKKTIPALCNWMGIKEEDSLYKMTVQGKKWWGDPSSPDFAKDGMNPLGKTSINRELGSVFSKNDQFILRTLFYPFSVRFGYAEENLEQFKSDLQAVRPMLDQMFDFEINIAQHTEMNIETFMKLGSYLYLRSGMIERWNTLNTFLTYPNMIIPLKIN